MLSASPSAPVSLIGLVGLKRSGKDTAAYGLVEHLGWRRLAFADPLKEMSLRLRGVWVEVPDTARMAGIMPLERFTQYYRVIEALGMDQAKELVPDVRLLLQTLGTDCVRTTLGTRTWTDLTGNRVRRALDNHENIVLTDVRFGEEMSLVRELGGITVGIWRGDTFDVQTALREPHDEHPSETTTYELLRQVDHLVFNNGTVRDLQRSVIALVGRNYNPVPLG